MKPLRLNIYDAPKGMEAVRDEGCEGCHCSDTVRRICTASLNLTNCMPIERKDHLPAIFRPATGKPRLVLNIGSQPTPPDWARSFRLYWVDGKVGAVWWLAQLKQFHWHHGREGKAIFAVEWLP